MCWCVCVCVCVCVYTHIEISKTHAKAVHSNRAPLWIGKRKLWNAKNLEKPLCLIIILLNNIWFPNWTYLRVWSFNNRQIVANIRQVYLLAWYKYWLTSFNVRESNFQIQWIFIHSCNINTMHFSPLRVTPSLLLVGKESCERG